MRHCGAATAYEKVGDVLGRWQAANLGEPRRALDAYRRAQAIREELAAADPGNSGIRRELASAYERIAELRFFLLGDPAGASVATGRMVRIEEALSTTDTAPAQSLRTGRSLAKHGYFLGASGHTLESLGTLRRAVTTLEDLTAVGSVADEARQELARTFGFLAEVLEDGTPVTGIVPDLRAAAEMCRRRLALSQALEAAEPGSVARRRAVSFAHVGFGEILFKLGDRRAALEQYRPALEIARALSAADPADRQLLFTLSGIHQRIGTALALEDQAPAAIRNLEIALTLLEPVIAADPTAATTRAYVADAYFGLGRAHAALGGKTALDRTARVAHWREARSRFQRSHAFWNELRQQGTTTGGSSARPDEMSRKIGECDVALAKLTSADGRP